MNLKRWAELNNLTVEMYEADPGGDTVRFNLGNTRDIGQAQRWGIEHRCIEFAVDPALKGTAYRLADVFFSNEDELLPYQIVDRSTPEEVLICFHSVNHPCGGEIMELLADTREDKLTRLIFLATL